MTDLNKLDFLFSMIKLGFKNNDKDSTRAYLEDLNEWLIQKNKLSE